jgi:hypothetical protein
MNLAFHNPGASQEEFRRAALQTIAFQLAMQPQIPQAPDEERALFMVMDWDQTVLSYFRKAD